VTEEIVVPSELAGARLDRCLALLAGRSRSEAAALIEAGAVHLDGVPATLRRRRVAAGQRLSLAEPPAPRRAACAPAPVDYRVVYEDEAIIVVDKPAGVVVHPGRGHDDDTLAAALLAAYPELAGVGEPGRNGIVHRLDKDTSGLLAVARTEQARAALARQLAERSMGRTYRALVLGTMAADAGVVEAPIGRSLASRTRMAVRVDGRPARTRYEVLARYRWPVDATELHVELETGRTHQIRVHLAAISHPVAGDASYGGRSLALGLRRPFLHAERLRVAHPTSGAPLELTSPLPTDLAAVLGSCS